MKDAVIKEIAITRAFLSLTSIMYCTRTSTCDWWRMFLIVAYMASTPLGLTSDSFCPHSFIKPTAISTESLVAFSRRSVRISSATNSCAYKKKGRSWQMDLVYKQNYSMYEYYIKTNYADLKVWNHRQLKHFFNSPLPFFLSYVGAVPISFSGILS